MVLKEFLIKHKPDLLCLIETKIHGDNADKICMRLGFDNWVRVEAWGFTGGLWIF